MRGFHCGFPCAAAAVVNTQEPFRGVAGASCAVDVVDANEREVGPDEESEERDGEAVALRELLGVRCRVIRRSLCAEDPRSILGSSGR